MAGKTVSEQAFEEYLAKRGLVARYEELPEGISTPVDYTLSIGGDTTRFDVKEWEPQGPFIGVGCFDPHRPLREKIEAARVKFKQYRGRGEACVLVLCHYGPQLIILDGPTILGAMRGDIGWVFPFDTRTGVGEVDNAKMTFLTGGSMVHHAPSGSVRVQNTTISAIAVLGSLDVRARITRLEFRKRELAADRMLTIGERFALAEEFFRRDEPPHVELRVAVYDNIDAAVALPTGFPNGPYDERVGRRGDRLARVYVGNELRRLEQEEAALGIRHDDSLHLRE